MPCHPSNWEAEEGMPGQGYKMNSPNFSSCYNQTNPQNKPLKIRLELSVFWLWVSPHSLLAVLCQLPSAGMTGMGHHTKLWVPVLPRGLLSSMAPWDVPLALSLPYVELFYPKDMDYCQIKDELQIGIIIWILICECWRLLKIGTYPENLLW